MQKKKKKKWKMQSQNKTIAQYKPAKQNKKLQKMCVYYSSLQSVTRKS